MFNDQDNDFDDNKLNNWDSVSVIGNPISDDEWANKKNVDESLDSGNSLKICHTLQNYLKVSIGNDVYNLNIYDKNQIRDTTKIDYPNTVGYLLQNWVIKCNDKKTW